MREQALRLEINTIKQLVERHDARSKQLLHRERLLLIADHVNGRPGSNLNDVGPQPCPERSVWLLNASDQGRQRFCLCFSCYACPRNTKLDTAEVLFTAAG